MFVDCSKHRFGDGKYVNGISISGGDIYAIISSLTWKEPTRIGVSTLFFKGQIDKNGGQDTYYVVPASTLDSTAVVISDVEETTYTVNRDDVIVMMTCDKWKSKFDTIDGENI